MTTTRGQTAWCVFALAMLIVVGLNIQTTETDFAGFYQRAAGLLPDPGRRPNLNTPVLDWFLWLFTLLPLTWAFWLWTLVGLVLLIDAVRRICQRLHPDRWPWLIGSLGASMPCLLGWSEGQLTWVFAYLVTRAWLTSPVLAGLWLAPIVAIKPSLALFALCLPMRTWATTATGSLLLCGLGVLSDPAGWQAWARLAPMVDWLGWPINASLWGVAARVTNGSATGIGLAGIGPIWLAVLGGCALIGLVGATLTRGADRWVLAICVATLLSPLGQIYYLPLALGPLAVSFRSSPWSIAALACLTIPMPLLAPFGRWPAGNILAGSVYFLGVLCAWIAWTRTLPRQHPAMSCA